MSTLFDEPNGTRIAGLLRAHWGDDLRIGSYEELSRRSARVGRLRIDGAGAPLSVIVKHAHPEEFGGLCANPEFREEQIVHRFLRACGVEEGLKPALYAWDPQGLTVLEDLGTENYRRMRSYAELVSMLSSALARLHAGTRDRQDEFLRLRRDAGIGDPGTDSRRYGSNALHRRARRGRDHLLDRAGRDGSARERGAILAELENAIELVEAPGEFLCLIHDDLGNARQTFEVADRLYLLDFEYARYAHGLLDLCKPLIGKFEMELDTGFYRWVNPNFPLALADAYRDCQLREHGIRFDDSTWEDALHAALTYAVLTMVGRLLELEADRPLVGTVPQNVNGILRSYWELVGERPVYSALAGFIPRHLRLSDLHNSLVSEPHSAESRLETERGSRIM